jgi:PAS domain-containing protein
MGVVSNYCIEFSTNIETPPPTPVYTRMDSLDHQMVRSGGTVKTIRIFAPERPLKEVYEGNASIFIWGFVRYEDVFGKIWRRGFGLMSDGVLVIDESNRTIMWKRAGGDIYNYDEEVTNEAS